MAAPRLTSRERRGILAVAAVALLVTGAGVALRLTRPTAPPLPQQPVSAKVLLPADTTSSKASTSSTQKTTSHSTSSTKKASDSVSSPTRSRLRRGSAPFPATPSTKKSKKAPNNRKAPDKQAAPASPLDRPVKTL